MSGAQDPLVLARRLAVAAESGDWATVADIDRILGAALTACEATAPERRTEWLAVRRAHDRARLQCQDATAALAERMRDAAANREGYLAYAVGGGTTGDLR